MVKPTICSKTYRSSADGEIFYDVLESLIVEKISPFEDSKFGIHFYDRTMTGSLDCVLEVAPPTAATTPPGSSTPPTLTATKVDVSKFVWLKKNLELSLPAMTDWREWNNIFYRTFLGYFFVGRWRVCVRAFMCACVLQCVRESVSCDAGTSKKQQHRHNSMDRVRTGPWGNESDKKLDMKTG